ncbi:MAG: hypothetical protein ACI9A7_001513 [Cyclobacteriaceae bacterium]|jgi:hypothetical protein
MYKFFLVLLLFGFLCNSSVLGQCPPSGGGTWGGGTITTYCTVTGDLHINGGSITIASGGSLTINGSFFNIGNGAFTVTGGGELEVTGSFTNGKNGDVQFLDGTISIGGDFVNSGQGTIASAGVVNIAGDFTSTSNQSITVSGGLAIGGTADVQGNTTIEILSGGVVKADSFSGTAPVTIANGGTIYVVNGIPDGTVTTNDNAMADTDCSNNCCGAQCTPVVGGSGGDALNETGNEALPVELLAFNVVLLDNEIEISWTSASELNNDFYEIERALTASSFETIAKIDGAGTSDELLKYTYRDYMRWDGIVYYRLKQTDCDGKFEYFKIKSIDASSLAQQRIKVFPNKAKSGTNIIVMGLPVSEDKVGLMFNDMSGKSSIYIELESTCGVRAFILPNIPDGIYLLVGELHGTIIRELLIVSNK